MWNCPKLMICGMYADCSYWERTSRAKRQKAGKVWLRLTDIKSFPSPYKDSYDRIATHRKTFNARHMPFCRLDYCQTLPLWTLPKYRALPLTTPTISYTKRYSLSCMYLLYNHFLEMLWDPTFKKLHLGNVLQIVNTIDPHKTTVFKLNVI